MDDLKLNINKLFDNLLIFYCPTFLGLYCVSDGIARRYAIMILILFFIVSIKNKHKKTYFLLFVLLVLIVYNYFFYGLDYITHQDFYGYILILLAYDYFSYEKKIITIDNKLTKNKITTVLAIFYVLVILSVLVKGGLRYSNSWGTTMPLLYGPYDLPHELAYQLLFCFALSSIGLHKYRKKVFFVFMVVNSVLLIWTAVRSAFLVLFIMWIFEYISLRGTSRKTLILFTVLFIFLYLVLFTDAFANNPIVQKTLDALSKSSGITNSRTDFNKYLFDIFVNELNFKEKFLGIGIDKLKYLMHLRYGSYLHAHNDVLNSLIGMGIVGFLLFFKKYIDFCLVNKSWIITFFLVFVLLFTNGLFMYVALTPSIFIFSIYSSHLNLKHK